VVADAIITVTPTITLNGVAIVSAYSVTEANARFALGLQFDTTNAASITVNGSNVAPAATITAANNAAAKTLGAHTYNVIVTSSTGHTANITVAYQVNADSVVPVTPTVVLNGAAALPTYTVSDANTRFATGVLFTVTNDASVTVNGSNAAVVGGVVTAADNAASKTVGAHTYNVVVTSSTGHTASVLVTYNVTVGGTDAFATGPAEMTNITGVADDTYANGWEWVLPITLPTGEDNIALKFNNWTSGANTLLAGGNMEYYFEEIALGAGSADSPVSITAAGTYPANVTVTDADVTTAGIQTHAHVKVKIPASTVDGSYSTSYRVNYVSAE
jgi:hypothetical protein